MDNESKKTIVDLLHEEARSRKIRFFKGYAAALVACFLFGVLTVSFLITNHGQEKNWIFVISGIIGTLACYSQAQRMRINSEISKIHEALMENVDVEEIDIED